MDFPTILSTPDMKGILKIIYKTITISKAISLGFITSARLRRLPKSTYILFLQWRYGLLDEVFLDIWLISRQSKIYLTLLITSGLTFAIPTSSAITGPTCARVTNQKAFTSGAGNKEPDPSLSPGVAGSDEYKCYSGDWQEYPDKSKWVSFTKMFKDNRAMMNSGCADLKLEGDSNDQIDYVHNAIIEVSKASLVDPRFILAIIMQEVCHFDKISGKARADIFTVHWLRARWDY